MPFGNTAKPEPSEGVAREPAEVLAAAEDALYLYVGHTEDGTKVVRDGEGLLHALTPLARPCPPGDQPRR